jgi:hypothetical protein
MHAQLPFVDCCFEALVSSLQLNSASNPTNMLEPMQLLLQVSDQG